MKVKDLISLTESKGKSYASAKEAEKALKDAYREAIDAADELEKALGKMRRELNRGFKTDGFDKKSSIDLYRDYVAGLVELFGGRLQNAGYKVTKTSDGLESLHKKLK